MITASLVWHVIPTITTFVKADFRFPLEAASLYPCSSGFLFVRCRSFQHPFSYITSFFHAPIAVAALFSVVEQTCFWQEYIFAPTAVQPEAAKFRKAQRRPGTFSCDDPRAVMYKGRKEVPDMPSMDVR